MTDGKKTDVEATVEELLEDPDSPDKGDTAPPQTIDAEPSDRGKDAR